MKRTFQRREPSCVNFRILSAKKRSLGKNDKKRQLKTDSTANSSLKTQSKCIFRRLSEGRSNTRIKPSRSTSRRSLKWGTVCLQSELLAKQVAQSRAVTWSTGLQTTVLRRETGLTFRKSGAHCARRSARTETKTQSWSWCWTLTNRDLIQAVSKKQPTLLRSLKAQRATIKMCKNWKGVKTNWNSRRPHYASTNKLKTRRKLSGKFVRQKNWSERPSPKLRSETGWRRQWLLMPKKCFLAKRVTNTRLRHARLKNATRKLRGSRSDQTSKLICAVKKINYATRTLSGDLN
jgi:hypothetical protein